jgi:hypothetical protein
MLTRDQLINLFSEANRKLFLGNDLYERCVRDGRRITREELERRLNFWRDNIDFSNMFRNCNVDDVTRICNFSPNQPVNDIVDNQCYNDVHREIERRREEITDVNACSICYEYNKQGELPNKIGCGHYFHYSCINEWVGRGNNTCPDCRQPINMLVGFPTENNRQLFERIQNINRNFAVNYMREMRMFMRPDEIRVFRAIFHNIQFEGEEAPLREAPQERASTMQNIFMFLILVFIHQLILRGSAYISTNIDPNYVPCFSRIETLGCMNANNMIENVILVPSNIYIAFQSIIILLSVLGNILDMIKNPNSEIIEVQGQVRNNIMEERNREEERRNLDLSSDDESDDEVYMGGGRWERR